MKFLDEDYLPEFRLDFKLDRERVGLIIVDMQYATASREMGLGRLMNERGHSELVSYRFTRIEDVVLPNIHKLLSFFRRQELPVIYVTFGSSRRDALDIQPHMRQLVTRIGNFLGTPEHAILGGLSPKENELVVRKTTTSAFNSTGIDSLLRAMGIAHLVFCGVSTNGCVESTARDAADRGYYCLLVEDCCAADFEDFHLIALMTFQRLLGRVASTQEVISELLGI